MTEPWKPGTPLILETERFRLAPIRPRDVDDTYVSWWNDEEIQRGLNMPVRNWGLAEARHHVSRFNNRRRFHLGITDKETGERIGFITLMREAFGRVQTNSVIGNKNYWGKKVVLEVRAEVLRFLFEEMGAEKVTSLVNARNLPSIYNYKAQGFTCEGILRDHAEWIEGGRVDMLNFGLLKGEWEAMQAEGEA